MSLHFHRYRKTGISHANTPNGMLEYGGSVRIERVCRCGRRKDRITPGWGDNLNIDVIRFILAYYFEPIEYERRRAEERRKLGMAP